MNHLVIDKYLETDLSNFFDIVDHDLLMHRFGRRIGDERVLRLIGRYLRAGTTSIVKYMLLQYRKWDDARIRIS